MWVEIGVIKKLVEANRKRHREMVRDAEVAERYYRKKNDILKKGARGGAGTTIPSALLTTASLRISTTSL